MKVTTQYAESHLEELASLAETGEPVEVVRDNKPSLFLVVPPNSPKPVRPRAELFGSLEGKRLLTNDWDSPETNEEISRLFYDGPIFPDQIIE